MTVSLGPLTNALRARIVEHGWLDDLAANRARGLPAGPEGQLKARTELLRALETQPSGLLGIYRDDVPVGMMTIEELAPETRALEVWLYVDPEMRRLGIGTQALEELLSYTFEDSKIFRVECKVLKVKHGHYVPVKFLHSIGFTEECFKKAAVWVDGSAMNQFIFRMLKPEWRRLEKKREKEEAA